MIYFDRIEVVNFLIQNAGESSLPMTLLVSFNHSLKNCQS